MKKAWKWILGIVIVLVVLGALVSVPLMLRNTLGAHRIVQQITYDRVGDGPRVGPAIGRYPMMGGRGFRPFGGVFMGFGMLLACLLPLGLLALLVYGAYRLGKRGTAPAPVTATPVVEAAPVRTCAKCSQPVQDDWRNCPHCGRKL